MTLLTGMTYAQELAASIMLMMVVVCMLVLLGGGPVEGDG